MTEPKDDSEKKIHIDSDWKEQVRQEKAKLSEGAASGEPKPGEEPTASAESSTAPGGYQLPKADFTFLISMLATQAFSALGQIPDPATGQTNKQPEVAKHMIDLLSVLDEKTKGNLSQQEALMLENVLHELRMAYVAVTKS